MGERNWRNGYSRGIECCFNCQQYPRGLIESYCQQDPSGTSRISRVFTVSMTSDVSTVSRILTVSNTREVCQDCCWQEIQVGLFSAFTSCPEPVPLAHCGFFDVKISAGIDSGLPDCTWVHHSTRTAHITVPLWSRLCGQIRIPTGACFSISTQHLPRHALAMITIVHQQNCAAFIYSLDGKLFIWTINFSGWDHLHGQLQKHRRKWLFE